MPTYEFRCPKGHEFEQFYRSISGAPSEVACPTCGKKSERQISAGGGLVFKGSGFYITDYGKDGKKSQTPPAAKSGNGASAGASGGSEAASAGGGGESAKGDSKSDAALKPAADPKPGGESKAASPKPAAASKSAAKGSARRAKSSE